MLSEFVYRQMPFLQISFNLKSELLVLKKDDFYCLKLY